MGAIAAALVGAVLLAVPGSPAHKKPTLGLDLQGGIEVVLRAVPDPGQQLSAEMSRRSNALASSHDAMNQLADGTGGKAYYNRNDIDESEAGRGRERLHVGDHGWSGRAD